MSLPIIIKNASIYLKIMASLCLLVLIPIIGLTIYHYVHQRHYSALTEVEKLKFYSMSLSSEVDGYLSGHQILVQALALDPQLQDLVQLHSSDRVEVTPIQAWLEQQTPISQEIESYFVLNRKGICIASTEPSFISKNYSVRQYFSDGMAGRLHVSDWSVGLTTHKPGVFFASPIKKNGHPVGVIVLKINASKIFETLRRSKDDALSILLVNRMGVVLVCNKPEQVYHSLSPLSNDEKKQLAASQQFADFQVSGLDMPKLKTAHDRVLQKGGTETCEYQLSGLSKVAALSRLKTQPWSIIISQPLDTIYSDSKIILFSAIVIAVILLVVTLLLGFLLTNHITGPVNHLLQVINMFGSGDMNVRAVVESQDEIGILAKSFNAMAVTIHDQTDNLEQKIKERTTDLKLAYRDLELAYEEISKLSNTDALTGCYNRRFLEDALEKELLRSGQEKVYISISICDIDFFKKVNDTYGHAAGDRVLVEFASVLKEVIRKDADVVCRYGGEEFVIIFPNTPIDRAHILVERIRTAVEKKTFVYGEYTFKITASFGVTSVIPSTARDISVASFIGKADDLLYIAKNGGRNQSKAEELKAGS